MDQSMQWLLQEHQQVGQQSILELGHPALKKKELNFNTAVFKVREAVFTFVDRHGSGLDLYGWLFSW